MNRIRLFLPLALMSLFAGTLRAQFPIPTDRPVDQNVRAAWMLDLDGGTDGDEWKAFELAYASRIYPLDQLVISYGHASPEGAAHHTVMLSVEETPVSSA